MAEQSKVAVIGGGISGLTSALTLQDRGHAVTVLESRHRLGGVICSNREDGILFEGGPDSVLSAKPATIQLLERLGMTERIISTRTDGGGTFILRDGNLVPLPQGLSMMVPVDVREIARTRLLSPAGKIRMALEYFVPPRKDEADESIGDFVRRRLGREALEFLAEPLLSGIYAGDVDQLSLAATFPRLRDAEREHGGVIRSVRASRNKQHSSQRPTSSYSPFVSLADGMGELIAGLRVALGSSDIRTGTTVSSIERDETRYILTFGGGHREIFDAVVLAVPTPAAAYLLDPLHQDLSSILWEIHCVSPVTVSIAFDERDLDCQVAGRGFVIPRVESRALTAVTWSSNKFDGRAPDGIALLKAHLGKAARTTAIEQLDDRVLGMVLDELTSILGITAAPIAWRVYRWKHGLPQYTIGHQQRVSRISTITAKLPRLILVGSAFQGIGIPDCIRIATEQSQLLADRLDASQARGKAVVA